jgi:hypothetical protein
MNDMHEIETEITTAIQHAGAVLLLALKNLGQGYTTLTAAHPEVVNGVEVAKTEAVARGATPEAVAGIGPDHVIMAAQQMGAAGADPVVVAAETKSEAVPPLTEAHLEEEQAAAEKEASEHPKEPEFVAPEPAASVAGAAPAAPAEPAAEQAKPKPAA